MLVFDRHVHPAGSAEGLVDGDLAVPEKSLDGLLDFCFMAIGAANR